jgi:hypothetical protein
VAVDVAGLLAQGPTAGPAADRPAAAAAAGGGALLDGLPGLTAPTSESYKFSIEGMSCGSCVASVQGAVGQVGHAAAAAAVRPV